MGKVIPFRKRKKTETGASKSEVSMGEHLIYLRDRLEGMEEKMDLILESSQIIRSNLTTLRTSVQECLEKLDWRKGTAEDENVDKSGAVGGGDCDEDDEEIQFEIGVDGKPIYPFKPADLNPMGMLIVLADYRKERDLQ